MMQLMFSSIYQSCVKLPHLSFLVIQIHVVTENQLCNSIRFNVYTFWFYLLVAIPSECQFFVKTISQLSIVRFRFCVQIYFSRSERNNVLWPTNNMGIRFRLFKFYKRVFLHPCRIQGHVQTDLVQACWNWSFCKSHRTCGSKNGGVIVNIFIHPCYIIIRPIVIWTPFWAIHKHATG